MPRTAPRKTNDSPLARLRIDRGLTQAQLAEMIGCYPKDVCRWETGERNPGAKSLIKLAAALNVPLESLLK